MRIIIAKIGNNPTVTFAFEELIRCLKSMDNRLFIDERAYGKYDENVENVLWIGLNGKVKAAVDDEIKIAVQGGDGYITGSNERSVLIAVYRFLKELGCRFILPGSEGELFPKCVFDTGKLNVQVSEKASYRHRAVCLEGHVSYEHVRDMIDWIPKLGMNGYYVQFQVPYCFFNRWYSHEHNPTLKDEPVSLEDTLHMYKRLEEEIFKRNLLYHTVGHGWTCEPFGIPGNSWAEWSAKLAPEMKQYLAEVDGKRGFWGGVPMNTNLCYSNPEVRRRMTEAVVEYCRRNPKVDYLHFWLADGENNNCECQECQKMRPADYYVMMLNELDRKLTVAGIDTKIVFLIYVDLLWGPEHYRLENQDRFVLMFAPITRTYSKSLTEIDAINREQLPPYVRNNLEMPKFVEENIGHLTYWQEQFEGDSFDFDYHLMWDHLLDPGYYECARILHKDMVGLEGLGLNGMVSCQVQRICFPTGLPMYAMAGALWNRESDFETVAGEYYRAAFGKKAEAVSDYMKTLSRLFNPSYLRGELLQLSSEAAADFAHVKQVVQAFREAYIDPEVESNVFWKYLAYHAEYCLILAEVLQHRALGETEMVRKSGERLKHFLDSTELELHHVLDTGNAWWFLEKSFMRDKK